MTTSTATEIATRRGRPCRPRSLMLSLAHELEVDLRRRYDEAANGPARLQLAQALGIGGDDKWPSERYRRDPAAFARDVLGVELWERQLEILLAVRDHMRVAVSSGHKIGKSLLDAVVALWFFCTHDEARVIMSSVTARQVDQILWREVRMLHRRATRPIGGELHELARSGLKAADFREIVGFTAREAEAVAGISGKNLLYILDEASGIGRDIFEAIEGNRAGGARVLMTSNPTRSDGDFFDAFHKYKAGPGNPDGIRCFEVSSEDSPNVKAGRSVIPGLATREWVEEKRREWGEDSDLFLVRVKGKFVRREEGRVINLHTIELAEQRWKDTVADGGLVIGLDPAGESGEGDETVYAVRRGLKVLELIPRRGLSVDGVLVNLLGVIREHRVGQERPRVVLDREGAIGAEVYGAIKAYLAQFGDARPFDLIPIRASDKAMRQADVWDRQRDALWGNLARWLRPVDQNGEGGAIPEDVRLEAELHAPEWIEGPHGRRKVTAKPELRKKLQRSPDRADAVALAVWDARPWETVEDEKPRTPLQRRPVLDPYGGAIDPYGRR
jgi:phage terminase large subunit